MTWRALTFSYFGWAAVVFLLLVLLYWLLSLQPLNEWGGPRPIEKTVDVALEAPPKGSKKEPEKKEPEKKEPEKKQPEGSAGTSTSQKGKVEDPTVVPQKPPEMPMPMPMPPMPMPMPMPMPPEMPKEPPLKDKGTPVPMPMPMMPPIPMVTPMPRPAVPPDLGQNEGKLPALLYTGRSDLLFDEFPRLEVCWVLARRSTPGKVLVEAEWVYAPRTNRKGYRAPPGPGDSEGRAYFEFTTLTDPYHREELVMVQEPEKLAISQRLGDAISQYGQVSANETGRRLRYGEYRHRAELSLLEDVKKAFAAAQAEGKIVFDPSQNDVLEVQWGGMSKAPVVTAVWFRPAKGAPIQLR